MRKRVLIALAAAVVLVALWLVMILLLHDNAQPIGNLSRDDVREIRAVVRQVRPPGWGLFTRANLRRWPEFVVMRLTFRIVNIREDTWGIVTIRPDGTREVRHPVIVSFKAHGYSDTCRVEWKEGRWRIASALVIPAPRGTTVPSVW
jgi:hypothetical protein